MLIEDRQAEPALPPGVAEAQHRPVRSFADSIPDSLRRLFGDAASTPGADLPPELAFLADEGVGAARLRGVAASASIAGVSGEAALLASGVSDETYYRLLARHLGVPYLEEPLPLLLDRADCGAASAAGAARLAPNRRRLHLVLAPRGEALRRLLADHGAGDIARYDFAVSTPRRLDALLRRHDRAGFTGRAASGLADWNAALSARGGATRHQQAIGLVAAVAVLIAFMRVPAAAGLAVSLLVALLFTAAVAHRLVAVAASRPPAVRATPKERQPDRDLPVYTVIVPLFREARVLPQLVRNIDALDYPPAKLDIRLMLEAGDRDTIAAVAGLDLPARYVMMVLPDGHPRTKPRALNAGLEDARGEFLVVYDAEDRPDPGQLRDALHGFSEGPGYVACLQARLAIDHAGETWMTRMFALEYAALFHVVKPGLAALGLPIPLGGTSNHFRVAALRRAGGWDSWNVTEDIDLGFRLARFGLAVRSLDSDTYEEAPLTLGRWLPQRSRWLKGWMVTLMVHGRAPHRLFRDLGCRDGLSVAVSLLGTIASCLVGPPLLAWILVEACLGTLFRPDSALWVVLVAGSAALLAGGVLAAAWPIVLGLKRLGRLDLAIWIVTLPVYLLLVSAACWRALFELWRDPQGWNKTEHGLARMRAGPGRSASSAVRRSGRVNT
jgi:cellulose synthase/poly-beta-1,6-N-acetylglucosamine synthase-like glycosyltransferase